MSKPENNEIEIPDMENVYGKLKSYLDKIKDVKQRETLFQAIREYLSHPETKNFDQFLNGGHKDLQTPILKRNRLEKIRQLYFGFGIPWNIFHPDLKEEHFLTDKSPKFSHLKEFERLSFHNDRDEEIDEFVDRYVGALETYIHETQKRLWVYEYLGKGRTHSPGTAMPHYAKAHKIIFGLIENQLKNHPNLEYKRLLALPLPDFAPFAKNDSEEIIQQKAGEALIECSFQTFMHICRCLKWHENQSKFYIVRRPPQIYHYGLLDDAYTVSEYYRYNSKGDFLPDLLFVEKVSFNERDKSRKLFNIYFKEIKKLTDERPIRSHEINRSEFIKAVERGYHDIIAKIKTIAQKSESESQKLEHDTWVSKGEIMELKIVELDKFFPNEISRSILNHILLKRNS